jgi:hypothetical protein
MRMLIAVMGIGAVLAAWELFPPAAGASAQAPSLAACGSTTWPDIPDHCLSEGSRASGMVRIIERDARGTRTASIPSPLTDPPTP